MNYIKENETLNPTELEILFNNVDVLLWSIKETQDGEYCYERVNMAFAKIMESSIDDYEGKIINEIASPEEFTQINNSLNHARKNGVYTYEKEIETAGTIRNYLIRIIYTANQDGSNFYICSGTEITKILQAEKALKKEKNQTQSYLDIIGVMFLVFNPDQTVRHINKRGCEILGYDEEFVIGKNWFDNFIPDNLQGDMKERFNKLIQGAKPELIYENSILTKSGEKKVILWHSSQIIDEFGNVTGLLSSGEDITSIRKVENELIKHNRTLETLHSLSEAISQSASIEDIGDGIALSFSTNKNVLAGAFYINENNSLTLINVFGTKSGFYDSREKLKLSDFLKTDRIQNKYNKIEKISFESGTYTCTKLNIALSIENEINGLLSLILVSEDDYTREFFNLFAIELGRGINRKQAEKELVGTKHLLEKITQNVPVFISIVELKEEKPVYYNKSILKSLGYSDNETHEILNLGHEKYVKFIYHPDDSETINKYNSAFELLGDEEEYEAEYRYKHKDGTWQWFRHTAKIFSRDKNGVPLQTINISQNITEHKRAVEELIVRNEQVIKQQAALIELSKLKENNIEDSFRKITEITSPPLQSDRTSIWLFNSEQSEIECKEIYLKSEGIHTKGISLKIEEFNNYFQAKHSKPFTTPHAENDPRTKEFTEIFLYPFDTRAILISRFRLNGEVVGMICFESKNQSKHDWSPEEYDFSLSVAGFISASLEAEERVKAEKSIINSLKEKELLLKEIHHRVKNNLQVISSLLYLQSKNIKDKEQANVFFECQSRIRTMVLVHEKLYQSKDIGRIEFSDYIKSLTEYLLHSFITDDSEIKIKIDVKDIYLTLDTAINCGLIINELISNSFKYAFINKINGNIEIKLYTKEPKESNNYILIVKDDGIGLPGDLDFRNTQTLGLQLVTTLVDQLGGSIHLDSGCGTCFQIQFSEKLQD